MAKDTTHIPPPAVASAARHGLELREKQSPSNRGGTEVGLARAKQLANREPVTEETMARMKSFFARHAVDASGEGWGQDSKGWQAWLLWGGNPGKSWVQSIAGERLKKMKEK
jgi:hypothetical protein